MCFKRESIFIPAERPGEQRREMRPLGLAAAAPVVIWGKELLGRVQNVEENAGQMRPKEAETLAPDSFRKICCLGEQRNRAFIRLK